MAAKKRKKVRPQPRFEQIPLEEIRALILASDRAPSSKQKTNGESSHSAKLHSSARKSRKHKPKTSKLDLAKDLWISPTLSLRGRHGDRAWDRSGNLPPGAGMRLLELADIALGLKKHAPKANRASAPPRQTTKSEPYSL